MDAWESVLDPIIRLDIEETLDMDTFFPFDDFISGLMYAFNRDDSVPNRAKVKINTARIQCAQKSDCKSL